MVESHGSSPASSAPWRQQPTRLLKLLDGYRAADQPVPVDAYGGRTDRPAQQATGFFRTVQLGERQWLIDPEGRPFYHLAVNQVREPPEVEANYGSADRWAATVVDQLRAAGFNGLGNGQSERLRNVARGLGPGRDSC